MRKPIFAGWRDITLQHDRLETEARDALADIRLDTSLDISGREANLVKLVKAAFFAGRQQIIDALNEGDDLPDNLTISPCRCGHSACTKVWLSMGGPTGFEIRDAMALKVAYERMVNQPKIDAAPQPFIVGFDPAAPGGDASCKMTVGITPDGSLTVIDAEFEEVTDDEPEHGWVFYGPDGEWHWSPVWQNHEAITDQRPATGVEAGLVKALKGWS